MNLIRKTSALILLGALSIPVGKIVRAQTNELNNKMILSNAHLPKMGGIRFDASLFVHVPPSKKLRLFSNGDGTGQLRVLDNLMRYDVSFAGGSATNVIWTNLDTDISVQQRHAPFTSDEPVLVESFIANLNKVPVIRLPDKHYDKDIIIDGKARKDLIVEDYYFDHKLVTTDHAFDGHALILKFGGGYIPILIEGMEKRVGDDDCGQYKPFTIQILELRSVTPNIGDMKPSSLSQAIPKKTLKAQHCTAAP